MVSVSSFPFMPAPGRQRRAPVHVRQPSPTSYRFLALEQTVQEIAEKQRKNRPLVPEKKAAAEGQANQ